MEDADQAVVVGEEFGDGDVAAARFGPGADVAFDLLGARQLEQRPGSRHAGRFNDHRPPVAQQLDAEAVDNLAVEIAPHERDRMHVAVVVAVLEVFGGRYAVDGRHLVATPECRVERAVDDERVVDLQQVESRCGQSPLDAPQFAAGVGFRVADGWQQNPVVGVFVMETVQVGAQHVEKFRGEQRILAQRIAAGVDLGTDLRHLGLRKERIKPRMVADPEEPAAFANQRAGHVDVDQGTDSVGDTHLETFAGPTDAVKLLPGRFRGCSGRCRSVGCSGRCRSAGCGGWRWSIGCCRKQQRKEHCRKEQCPQ